MLDMHLCAKLRQWGSVWYYTLFRFEGMGRLSVQATLSHFILAKFHVYVALLHTQKALLLQMPRIWRCIHSVISGIFYQQHDFSFLHQTHDFSPITPFKRPPCVSDIRSELRSRNTMCKPSNARSSVLLMQNGRDISHIQSTCLKCSRTQCLPLTCCAYFTTPMIEDDNGVSPGLGPLLHALILPDCSNTASAVHRWNPRTDEKCYRIICCYLEGFLRFLSVNYCNAAFNLSDTETNKASTAQIWRTFLKTGAFKIGF